MGQALSFMRLRQRYLDDTRPGGPGGAPALTRALEHIGWQAVRDPSPEELVQHLVLLLDTCVYEHRDLVVLTDGIATALRDTGPSLDGGLPPVQAYLPVAEELLHCYVTDDGAPRSAPLALF